VYQILPTRKGGINESVLIHATLLDQIENPEKMDLNLWRCLGDSMWSEHLPVQIVSWRMLSRLGNFELVEQMYFDEEDLAWAKASGEGEMDENKIIHRDSNGVVLETGDSVVLIKDLKVKGSSMVAKQGTAVRNIRLDHENADYIEGRVDGQTIVIITQYVKKI
jgi:protein PhnA